MSGAAGPQRLHPVIPLVSLVKQLPEMLLPIIGVVAVVRDEGFGMALLAAGGVLAIVFAFQVLAWWRFTYTLLPDEMYIESGIFSRNGRSIPWDRVQDVEIERGPLARVFGLAKVKLETGGSGSDEGMLDSIGLSDALALRDEVRARRGVAVATSPQEEAARPPVFKMTSLRLLQAGLFNFSVIWVAVIAGAIQYFKELLPWSEDDVEEWIGVHRQEIWGLVGPVTILLALGLFLVLGTIAGVIQMFVRNYGFTLSLDGRTLRRVRGLVTRGEIAMSLLRIQAARTVAGWLTRRFGLCRVEVQTTGGTSSSGGLQEVAPLANAGEAARVLLIAGHFERIAPERFEPVASVHRWYDAQTEALPLALIAVVAGFVSPVAWWGVVFAALLGTVQVIAARPHGWRLQGDMLHVRRGWFSQDHWLLPLASIQSVSLSTGPLQRRLDLATIAIDSAGGQSDGLRIRNLAIDEARALVELFRTWRHRGRTSGNMS